ncbi:MAG: exodeoxyribonuclease VII small subunit [Anaerolinea sp.]|nr:exodeoxyribonuclease VII small subunit [Anaerolinea sp.]
MAKSQPPVESLSYEQAFLELEGVVSALEAGQSNLEDALALFERGQALAKRCAGLLDQAEVRVRRLAENEPDLPVETDEEA